MVHRKGKIHRMKINRTFLTMIATVAIAACGGARGGNDAISTDSTTVVAEGAKHYLMCSRCHGALGAGVPGEYPPLAGSVWDDDPGKVMAIVMHGLRGPIVRNGISYDQVMAPGPRFSDRQFAELISYIRTFEGNSGALVSVKEMAAARAAIAGRKGLWTEAELAEISER